MSNTRLLSLPDELVERIWTQVYEIESAPLAEWSDHQARAEFASRPPTPPFSRIVVNRRVYRLCRSIWFRRVVLPRKPESQANKLAGLLDTLEALPHRGELIMATAAVPLLHAAVLKRLPTLTRLSVTFSCESVPQGFTRLLTELPALSTLSIKASGGCDDTSFRLPSLLQLRDLCIVGSAAATSLLRHGAPQLESLTLCIATLDVQVPWETVQRLRIDSTAIDFGMLAPGDFLEQVRRATAVQPDTMSRKIPALRDLTFDFDMSVTASGQMRAFCSEDLAAMLALFDASTLQILDLRSIRELKWIATFQVKTVERLYLSGTCDIAVGTHFSDLVRLVRAFPNLQHLEIAGFAWSSSSDRLVPEAQMAPADRLQHYPHLCALERLCLASAVRTLVLRQGRGGAAVIKFERSDRGEWRREWEGWTDPGT